MFDILGTVMLGAAGAFRINTNLRKWVLITSGIVLVLAGVSLLAILFSPPYAYPYRTNLIGIGVILGLIGLFGFAAAVSSYLPEKSLNAALHPDEALLSWLKKMGEVELTLGPPTRSQAAKQEHKPYDIIEGIQSNLGHLLEYYIINKGQAKSSFRASTTSIAVGFLTIIGGIWLSYAGRLSDNSAVYISVLAGVILQFIGAAYFYLYNRSLVQLNFFFNRLALMQDTLLAIRLTESIPEGEAKHKVLEKLVFTIATRDPKTPQYVLDDPKPAPRTRTSRAKMPSADAA
ncbi:hypothetical protein GFB56_15600 [Ensifer sp. T173]|uniref:Cyanobacterial TRADD-N associated 2 transmembrane domain-containing protein n=1 Tax=Ensifer canadensis TaxID=555315 RepID=A0AAW4FN22_9HYPH|nr:hypothetical protein [Ensifer canadensis]MBM3092230.1 hypothetical protein [Ensifer canadensis]UBI73954.1 hypothetical protein J3R84_10485 [Ensifer canadensis]